MSLTARLSRDRRGLERYAFEEAEHASKFAELLGEVVTDSTKKNLQMRVDAECGACAGKMDLAKKAKELNLDASTTPSMRWRRTRPAMAAVCRACWTATSNNH